MTASSSFVVDGFRGEPTVYEWRVGDTSFDLPAGEVTVSIEGRRDNDSAFVDDAEFTLFIDNEPVAEGTNDPVGTTFSEVVEFTVPIELIGDTKSFAYAVIARNWERFGGSGVPEAEAEWIVSVPGGVDEQIDVSCDVETVDPFVDGEVSVTAVFDSSLDAPVDLDVSIRFGDATETTTLPLPAGDEGFFEAVFEPQEPGTIVPEIEWSAV